MRESTKYVMDKITCSLIELMRETSLGNISICAIIENAEVSRNSFYRHFQDLIFGILFLHVRSLSSNSFLMFLIIVSSRATSAFSLYSSA